MNRPGGNVPFLTVTKRLFVFSSAAVFLGAASATAGVLPAAADTASGLRVVNVTRTDNGDALVAAAVPASLTGTGLPAGSFHITESAGGGRTTPATVLDKRPGRVLLVVGTAGSAAQARAAGIALGDLADLLPDRTEVGLVAATARPLLLVAPTTARGPLLRALEKLTPASGDDAPALRLALGRMTPRLGNAVVLLDTRPGIRAFDAGIVGAAGWTQSTVEVITPDPAATALGLVTATGGAVVSAGASGDYATAAAAVARDLNGRFLVRFRPSGGDTATLTVGSGARATSAAFVIPDAAPTVGQVRPSSRAGWWAAGGVGLAAILVGAVSWSRRAGRW